MECPQCGYVLDPFAVACPRCARMATQTPPALPPVQDQEVLAAVNRIAPIAQQRMTQQTPIRYQPELGWTLTITLWIGLVLQALLVILALLSAIGLQIIYSDDQHIAVPILVLLGMIPALRLIALIGILKCQRWGVSFFMVFSVCPIAFSLLLGHPVSGLNWVNIALTALIVVLILAHWDSFD